MAKRKKNKVSNSKTSTTKRKSNQKNKKPKLIKGKEKKATVKKSSKSQKKGSTKKKVLKKSTKKQVSKPIKQEKNKHSKEKLNTNKFTIKSPVKKQEKVKKESVISNDKIKKEKNDELLDKIVNASIAEEIKIKQLLIKKGPEESASNNNFDNTNDTQEKSYDSIAVTENAPKKRKRKRKRVEKTWEEKAKSLPVFEVSNFPKLPVKNILITQTKPTDLQNPYQLLIDKYDINITFRPFIRVEGLTEQEFRNQRVDILEYKNIIFTSRLAIDNFFRILSEMRIVMPDTTMYFCLNEQLAYYMQKYMELRKRKIFWGSGSLDDLKKVLKKHINGKFLLPASDTIKEKVTEILNNINAKYTTVNLYKTIPENISDIRPEKYDMMVFFTPIAVEALKRYFPKFKQNKTRFAAYSILTANKLKELGYRVDIFAPTLEFPSMVNAIAHYLLHIGEK